MDKSSPCVEALRQGLSDSFAMYFRAHAYHWNVEGPDFHEYHGFFSEIYSDVYGSIDSWAENIRKMGAMAPQSLAEIGMPSRIEDVMVGSDPMSMCIALYEANEVVIESVNVAFMAANDINEQGIANFLAERDAMHKKWRWQLNSITGLGKSKDEPMMPEEPIEVAYDVNEPMPYEEDMIFFGDRAEKALADRLERYNKKAPASLIASAETVKAVYRRGALTAASTNDRHISGMARVDAFLRLMSAGRPANSLYTEDNDLLPKAHSKSTSSDVAMVASAVQQELARPDLESIEKPEDFVVALAELSGLGYEIEPSIRASWLRAVGNGENPRERATELALQKYDSQDADLLPVR